MLLKFGNVMFSLPTSMNGREKLEKLGRFVNASKGEEINAGKLSSVVSGYSYGQNYIVSEQFEKICKKTNWELQTC